MPVDVIMPPLSQTMDSLLLVEWTRQVGDSVTQGETLFLVETDKATLEVEAPASGVLQAILAEPGSEVKARAKIGQIALPGEQAAPVAAPTAPGVQGPPRVDAPPAADEARGSQAAPAGQSEPASQAAPVPQPAPAGEPDAAGDLPAHRRSRIPASPRARRLAAQEGVALGGLAATGPQGMIVERDVRAFLAGQPGGPRLTPLARRVAQEAGLDPRSLAAGAGRAMVTRDDVEAAVRARAAGAEPGLASQAAAGVGEGAPGAPDGPEAAATAVPSPAAAGRSGHGAGALPAVGGEPAGAPPEALPGVSPGAALGPLPGALPGSPSGPSRRVPLSTLRKTIARRMQASHSATAAVTLTRTADATELKRLRETLLADPDLPAGVRPTYTDFLVKIVARCLGRHPALNAHFDGGDAVEVFEQVHISLAVDSERGLLAPVIRGAAGQGVLELVRARANLAQRVADGTITPDELAGGTFTISNLGVLGVDAFTPIINPPQVAILGAGRIHAVPAVYEGQVAVREQMVLSLTFDHRIIDGGPAARFLADVVQLIEKPERIWL